MRECEYCFKELVQRPDESDHAYAIRRTCNKSHAAKLTPSRSRFKQDPVKIAPREFIPCV